MKAPLAIRVADCAYDLWTSSPEAEAFFRRAYAACLGEPAAAASRITLVPVDEAWQARRDGIVLGDGDLVRAMALIEWELLRNAVQEKSTCAVFHAAWVASGGRAVVLAGEGSTGKSGLCLELLTQGFLLGAEDAAFFQADRLVPFPRALQLRAGDPSLATADAQRLFPGCDGRLCVEVRREETAGILDVRAATVIFLDPPEAGRGPHGDGPEPPDPLIPLDPLSALRRMFSLCFRLDRVAQATFEAITRLAASGRMFALRRDTASRSIPDIMEMRV